MNVGDQTKIRLPLLMLLALLGIVASAAVVWSGDHTAVADHATQLAEHGTRLRKLEDGANRVEVMRNDVEWIRRALEQQQKDRR